MSRFRFDCYSIPVECDTAGEVVSLIQLMGQRIQARQHRHEWRADKWDYSQRCRCGKVRRLPAKAPHNSEPSMDAPIGLPKQRGTNGEPPPRRPDLQE